MTLREQMAEVVETHDGMALQLARAIKRLEGWRCSDTEARKRLRQCLHGTAGRHFCVDWLEIFAATCVDHGATEPVTGTLDTARRDREYELRQEARQMRTVRPQPINHVRSA